MKVAVIGAAGHVGLPFSLVVADAGHEVVGIDLNSLACEHLNQGFVNFVEEGAETLLNELLFKESIRFTSDYSKLNDVDVISVMIGTPVDGEGNPRLDDLLDFVDIRLGNAVLKKGVLIILRSTVAPGTTELIKYRLEQKLGMSESKDFTLVFAPERVAQGVGIQESKKFPQLVGAFSDRAFIQAQSFFRTFVKECIQLTPVEAELGKLMTNMYRYVNFALANEFYMIGDKHRANIDKVIKAINKDYPRMHLPLPGPNVGGPCLFKDGKFLLSDTPFVELIQTSFIINEGMPEYVFRKTKNMTTTHRQFKKVGILGSTFKAGSDDERNSLSFKFAKICRKNGVHYTFFDPLSRNSKVNWDPEYLYDPVNYDIDFESIDAWVVMTPHKEFIHFFHQVLERKAGRCVSVIDPWKLLPDSKQTTDGSFFVNL